MIQDDDVPNIPDIYSGNGNGSCSGSPHGESLEPESGDDLMDVLMNNNNEQQEVVEKSFAPDNAWVRAAEEAHTRRKFAKIEEVLCLVREQKKRASGSSRSTSRSRSRSQSRSRADPEKVKELTEAAEDMETKLIDAEDGKGEWGRFAEHGKAIGIWLNLSLMHWGHIESDEKVLRSYVARKVSEIREDRPGKFYIGITQNPLNRWHHLWPGKKVRHRDLWEEMWVLAGHGGKTMGRVEKKTIELFEEDRLCTNVGPGSEGAGPETAFTIIYLCTGWIQTRIDDSSESNDF